MHTREICDMDERMNLSDHVSRRRNLVFEGVPEASNENVHDGISALTRREKLWSCL